MNELMQVRGGQEEKGRKRRHGEEDPTGTRAESVCSVKRCFCKEKDYDEERDCRRHSRNRSLVHLQRRRSGRQLTCCLFKKTAFPGDDSETPSRRSLFIACSLFHVREER